MQKITTFFLSIITSITSIFISHPFVSPIPNSQNNNQPVLEEQISPEQTTKTIKTAKKKTYRIAFLGDSMTDLLGDEFPFFRQIIERDFPKSRFEILNYGIGATNIDSGLARLTNKSTRHTVTLEPLLPIKPDIIIFESFAYNQGSVKEKEIEDYKITVEKIISQIKKQNIQIIMALTIAPNSRVITDGITEINLTQKQKAEKAQTIEKYLEIFKQIALENKLPLADAYNSSMDSNNEGKLEYISTSDHLHPSEEGLKLYSEKVAEQVSNLIQ